MWNGECVLEPSPKRDDTLPSSQPISSAPQFADYLLGIAEKYPRAETIHLLMDNLNSHRPSAVERFGEREAGWLWDRFTVHYTPKHGSRLNQADIEISLFSRQCLGKRRIGDPASLRQETRAWNRRVNRDRVTIQWAFARKKARQKFAYTITRLRCLVSPLVQFASVSKRPSGYSYK